MKLAKRFFLASPLVLQTAVWPVVRPLLWFFCHLSVDGLENLKNLPAGVIFTANHTSELDPIFLPASLPFLSRFMPMFYVSRPRSFYKTSGWRQFFYGRFLFKLWGAHPAISGYRDYGLSLALHIQVIRCRKSLFIFPEGRKTIDGKVMVENAKGGAAFLAEKTGLPIVPVSVSGAFKITPAEFFGRRRSVRLIFGRPIYAHELFDRLPPSENRYKAAAREVMKIISETQPIES